MDSRIKNIVKCLSFLLCLVLPFWISRLWLLWSFPNLTVSDPINYLFHLIRFDLKALAIWYSPLFIFLGVGLFIQIKWWQFITRITFSLLFLFALVFNLIAVLYFPISKTIVGGELFQLLSGQSLWIVLGYITEYWYVIILILSINTIILRLFKRLNLIVSKGYRIFLVIFTFLAIGFFARGGVALKPLNLMDAYAELTNEEVTTAITPLYILLESYGKQDIQYEAYFSDVQLNEALSNDKKIYNNLPFNRPNICLILLESFGKEYTGINQTSHPSYTPFLDSLMDQSVNFTNAYANGLRSIDAVASCLAGIPCLMKQPFIGSLYTQSDVKTIPKVLKKDGYTTSFFHGADELSMGFKRYLQFQDIDNYYAKQNYPDISDFDGTWGIYDEPFLEYCGKTLSNQKQPWFSGIFTLSSHHPYKIPQRYNYLPKGTIEIHQSIGYTDHALAQFFKSVQSESWFENTIFIITADHSSLNETPMYRSSLGKYAVPLFIYSPKWLAYREETQVAQHIDIYSTIRHITSTEGHVSFGNSLLSTRDSQGVVLFDGNIYNYANDSLTIEWNGNKHVRLFNYRSDPAHQNDLSAEQPKLVERMLQELKMYTQKYNYRLLNNNFNNQ